MSWLLFAFSGPVLWAISVHLDKYLVERFFQDSNVVVGYCPAAARPSCNEVNER